MDTATSKPQPKIPLRFVARQRIRFVGSVPYASGQQASPIRLPEVGFLSGIIIQVDGVMNFSGAGTLVDKGAWNLLKQITVDTNLGTSNIVTTSGFGAYLTASDQKRAFSPDGGGVFTPPSLVYAAPLASGNNTWRLMYYIPIACNDTSEFETGLINLQAPEIQCNVGITFGTGADVVAANLGTGFSGTASVYYCYFDVPTPAKVQWPAFQIVRTVEENQPITYTGDFTYYQVLRQGYAMNFLQYVTINGALSNAVDEFNIRINKNDTVYVIPASILKLKGLMSNSVVFPTGCYSWGLWSAMGNPSEGDTRDGFNTERVTTLEIGAKVTSGTGLGSGNNFFTVIRRALVNLVSE